MAREDLHRWFQEGNGIAALWKPSGLLRREIKVPPCARALRLPDGKSLLPSGTPLEGEAIFIHKGEVAVPVNIQDLVDREQVPGTLKMTLYIEPPNSRVAVLLLRDHCLKKRNRLDTECLAEHLGPLIRSGVVPILTETTWDGEDGLLPRIRKGGLISRLLKDDLFGWGLSLIRVVRIDVESETVTAHRESELKLREESRRIRERLEFLELWKREEMGEVLARDEVEKMAAHLQRQGLLRNLEHKRKLAQESLQAEKEHAQERSRMRRILEREQLATQMEIDEERLAYEIEKAKRLQKSLEDAGILGAVTSVKDPLQKERLIELLIQKEMSPEQIAAQVRVKEVQQLEERIERVAADLRAELIGGSPPPWCSDLPEFKRIWLAAGLALYRIDSAQAFQSGEPTPVLPPEDLGYLRSLHVVGSGDSTAVLVGAQAGVLEYRPKESTWTVLRYRPAPRGRGGANSVAILGDR
ncbi:MAG: hypothetical protein V3T77_11375, partial [Planctomycetota bacterium]